MATRKVDQAAAEETKRDYGSGGIVARGKDMWRLSYRTLDGKRKFSTFKGTEPKARAELRWLVAAAEKGEAVEHTRDTMSAFLERWLSTIAPTVSVRTLQGYRGTVSRYLAPAIGGIPLQKLTAQHVQEMYSALLARGLSARTVHHTHVVLSGALDKGVRWNLLLRNPARFTDPPRPEAKDMHTLGPGDVPRYFDAIRGDVHEGLFLLTFYTGARRSEVLALRWPQADLEQSVIRITGGLHRIIGKGLVVLPPKSKTSRRAIELPARAVEALRKVRVAQMKRCLKLGVPFDPDGYFFDSPHDEPGRRPLDPEALTRHFTRLMKKAGLPVNVHGLRHSHATLLLAVGELPKVVQERLDHSTITLTLQTYSHTLPTMGRQAADRFTRFITEGQ